MSTNNKSKFKNICFIDTETTSLLHSRRPWEVAVIQRSIADPSKRTEHLFQIKDVDLTDADLIALNIGGFFERYEGYKGTPKGHVYTELEASVMLMGIMQNAHVIGAVPNFDTETIEMAMKRVGKRSTHHYHLGDVENFMVGYIRGLQFAANSDNVSEEPVFLQKDIAEYNCQPPWNSEELSRLLGVEPPTEEERHTAMGDALWAERVYDRVMGIS